MDGQDAARPTGVAGEVQPNDSWVSELKVDAEAMDALVLSIAGELDDLAAAGDGLRMSVDGKLSLILDELQRQTPNLILVSPVVTPGTADLLAVNLSFCPLAYRRAAEAAKDRVRNVVNTDGVFHGSLSSFTGELPKHEWRIEVSGGVAYISTRGRNGFREYFAADLVPRDPKDQAILQNLEGAFGYLVDGAGDHSTA